MNTATLIRVVTAWSRQDDWDVETIPVSTLAWLADMLDKGVDPDLLAAHAKHTLNDCLHSCGDWLDR